MVHCETVLFQESYITPIYVAATIFVQKVDLYDCMTVCYFQPLNGVMFMAF